LEVLGERALRKIFGLRMGALKGGVSRSVLLARYYQDDHTK
jgi:hypothetical protein